ncbi:MAG: hypothetical protein ACPGYV_01495 [Phycisphaeraceae bacterium]
MNVLTKAFVVVVTILSVVLVALVVPFAARVPNYAEQFEQMKQDRDAQLKLAQDARNEILNDFAKKGEEFEATRDALTTLTAELDRANADNKALQTKLDQAQTTLARNSAAMEVASRMNASQSDQITQQADVINKQIAALGDLQGQNADLNQVLIDTKMDVRRLSDNYLRIQEENKALSQQLIETQAKLDTSLVKLAGFMKDAGVVVEQDAGVLPPDGTTIRGSVTKVDQPTEGITFVQVNVGKRDLVKEGMEFVVYRGDKYVANVKIASVDTAESVGTLTLGGGIQEGDAVRAGGR